MIHGSKLSGLYNIIAEAFDSTVRSYVASNLEAALRKNMTRYSIKSLNSDTQTSDKALALASPYKISTICSEWQVAAES